MLDEVAREFDGEDPLLPVTAGVLEKARDRLKELHAILAVPAHSSRRSPMKKRSAWLAHTSKAVDGSCNTSEHCVLGPTFGLTYSRRD